MLITSVIDAQPVQVLRVLGPTFLPIFAAIFTGGIFIFSTFKLWAGTAVSTVLALATILYWCWTGTALVPEKDEKYIGHGTTVPLYASGPNSVGWWAMFITMLADVTAFATLVFGYFFYWSLKSEFPPDSIGGPGYFWPAIALIVFAAAWGLTIAARRWNRADDRIRFYAATCLAAVLGVCGSILIVYGPWQSRMDPTEHVYSATIWLIAIWTAVHALVGVVMQLYCVARRWAGRMTARYDIDISNVALYWHFMFLTALAAVAVMAGSRLLA